MKYNIPKNLFFIWITEKISIAKEKPKFSYYSIEKFKEINNDWNIIEITDNSNEVQECRNFLQKNPMYHPSGMFTDILRLFVIFKYGGIYIDHDCFPVRKIDDYINNYSFIKAQGDIFALASIKRNVEEMSLKWYDEKYLGNRNDVGFFPNYNYFVNPKYNNGYYKDVFNKNDCMKLKDKFWNCTLQFGDKIETNSNDELYYFDHYRMSIWNNDHISIRNTDEMNKYCK